MLNPLIQGVAGSNYTPLFMHPHPPLLGDGAVTHTHSYIIPNPRTTQSPLCDTRGMAASPPTGEGLALPTITHHVCCGVAPATITKQHPPSLPLAIITTNYYHQTLTITKQHSPPPNNAHHHQTTLTTTKQRSPSPNNAHHHQTTLTTTKQRSPPPNNAHHHQTTLTTTKQHSPSLNNAHHHQTTLTTTKQRSPPPNNAHHH